MANTVKMKQSAVAGKVPTTAQLALGELAINTVDGKLFLKKSVSGVESIVDVSAGGVVSGAPQMTVLTSGSGTYTVPAGAKYLTVEMVGGGGGGGGSGTSGSAGNGGIGGTTTFWGMVCGGGDGGGGAGDTGGGGVGGTAALNGAVGIATNGQDGLLGGGSYNQTTYYFSPSRGFNTPLGSYGRGGHGGGSGGTGVVLGAGAGAGAYIKAMITNLAASYSYAVGAAGTAGAIGSYGQAGYAGGSGCIIVTAYF